MLKYCMTNMLWLNQVFLSDRGDSRTDKNMCKMAQKCGSQKLNRPMQISIWKSWKGYKSVCGEKTWTPT